MPAVPLPKRWRQSRAQGVGIRDEIFGLASSHFLNHKEQNISSAFLKPKHHIGRLFDIQNFQLKQRFITVKKLVVISFISCVSSEKETKTCGFPIPARFVLFIKAPCHLSLYCSLVITGSCQVENGKLPFSLCWETLSIQLMAHKMI